MPFPRSAFSGFPFEDPTEDDTFGRDGFRSQLDSLAARHPQFAQQLRTPWAGGSWARKRRGSGSLAETNPRAEDTGTSTETPPPRHEDHRGFPFDDFPSDFRQHIPPEFEFPREFQTYSTIPRKPRQRAVDPRQQFITTQPQTPIPEVSSRKDFSTQTETPQEQRIPLNQAHTQTEPLEFRTEPLSHCGLRNTVDLGQKVSQLDDSIRNQRSMSAPPDSRQRFISRISIDPLQNPAMGQYSSANKTNQPAATTTQQNTPQGTQSGKGPTVRHIPIFVEGRDEPVVNKNNDPCIGTPKQPVPEPTVFVQNVHKPQAAPGSIFRAAQGFAPHQPQKPLAPNEQCPLPQQPPMVNDPISKIQMIQKDVLELMSQVEVFVGTRKDKQYGYLDEMLTRNLLKLDDVETEGKDNIRQARKEAIRCIQKCIAVLEAKADGRADKYKPLDELNNQTEYSKMEVEEASNNSLEKSQSQKMEVENSTDKDSISKNSSKKSVINVATKSDSKTSVPSSDQLHDAQKIVCATSTEIETKPTRNMEVGTQVATDTSH